MFRISKNTKLKKQFTTTDTSPLPQHVIEACFELLKSKLSLNSISSKHLKSIRRKENDLIPFLSKVPFFSDLGSITVYSRISFTLSEEDVRNLREFCEKNNYRLSDFVETKVKYSPTPLFRNILLSKGDVSIPNTEKVAKRTTNHLHIKLSI
ncbi:MAG: hypothetical protein AB9882_13265 [Ignavibacteriaceae bacterium]